MRHRKDLFFLLSILIIPILTVACGEQAEPVDTIADTTAVVEVPEEVDLTVEVPLLRIGYVKQDHHSAVFVSALRGEEMRDAYGIYLMPMGEQFYALVENGRKVAEIEFVQSQGAINVPNNMVAGLFDVGFGGVTPFAASADQGSGIRIIAPLHSRGDMLVVGADNEAVTDWDSFLSWVNSSPEPVVIGFKSPQAVALILIESALTEAGVPWSMQSDPVEGSRVLLFNAQGEPNLNPSLENGTIQAYVSNNPSCAMAEYNGIGKCVANLCDLPPGDFADHPCCAISATSEAIAEKSDEIVAALLLFAAATDYINQNPEDAAAVAAEWIGNPLEVELASMATSGYDMSVTPEWIANNNAIFDHMRSLGAFTGPMAAGDHEVDRALLYDFSLLPDELK